MNEKLKKEAEEYANNVLKDVNCTLGNPRARHINSLDIEEAYLASAEPREKRIAELEQENADLKEEVNKVAFENGELKEENAELKKEWQEQVQKATDEGYARTLQTVQLTKAKELLKGWLGDFYSPKAFYQQRAELVEQSEQFLKENSTYERIQKAKYNYTD